MLLFVISKLQSYSRSGHDARVTVALSTFLCRERELANANNEAEVPHLLAR